MLQQDLIFNRRFEIRRSFLAGVYPDSEYECKAPLPTRTVYTSSLVPFDIAGYRALDSFYPSPVITYVGCAFDGEASRSVFKYSIDTTDLAKNLPFGTLETLMYCADQNGNYRLDGRPVAILNGISVLHDHQYFSLYNKPFCYNYQLFQRSFFTSRALPKISVPLENCSECKSGMMKIAGKCTCPEGFVESETLGCQRESKCSSLAEFYSGQCSCPRPYRSQGLGANNSTSYYSCQAPPSATGIPVVRPDDGVGSVTGGLTISSCEVLNGAPTFTVNYLIQNTRRSQINIKAYCADAQFGSSIFYTTMGAIAEGSFKYTPQGDCYKWKVIGMDGFSAVFEQEFNLPSYPFCK